MLGSTGEIPEIALLKVERPLKEEFPFYGWAVMKFDMAERTVAVS